MRRLENTNVYIGSLKDAQNKRALRKARIKVIMNVCSDIDTPYYHDIILVKWGLDDPAETLAPRNRVKNAYLVLCNASVVAEELGGNILIHCAAGNNRSALVAALYLYKWKYNQCTCCPEFTFKEAVKAAQVKDKKPWMVDLGYDW